MHKMFKAKLTFTHIHDSQRYTCLEKKKKE